MKYNLFIICSLNTNSFQKIIPITDHNIKRFASMNYGNRTTLSIWLEIWIHSKHVATRNRFLNSDHIIIGCVKSHHPAHVPFMSQQNIHTPHESSGLGTQPCIPANKWCGTRITFASIDQTNACPEVKIRAFGSLGLAVIFYDSRAYLSFANPQPSGNGAASAQITGRQIRIIASGVSVPVCVCH